MSYGNRNYNNNRGGGNYGSQRRGNYGGGGNRSYNRGNNGANADDIIYVSTGVKKYIADDNGKQRVDLDEFLTEEFGFALTNDKARDLIAKLQGAIETSEVGGAYVSMYLSRKKNRTTGEEFNGIRILVNKQNAPDERFQRGNFRGNAGGGRRDYPSRGGNGGGYANSNNYNSAPQNNYTPPAEPRNEGNGYANTAGNQSSYRGQENQSSATAADHSNNQYQNEPEF